MREKNEDLHSTVERLLREKQDGDSSVLALGYLGPKGLWPLEVVLVVMLMVTLSLFTQLSSFTQAFFSLRYSHLLTSLLGAPFLWSDYGFFDLLLCVFFMTTTGLIEVSSSFLYFRCKLFNFPLAWSWCKLFLILESWNLQLLGALCAQWKKKGPGK